MNEEEDKLITTMIEEGRFQEHISNGELSERLRGVASLLLFLQLNFMGPTRPIISTTNNHSIDQLEVDGERAFSSVTGVDLLVDARRWIPDADTYWHPRAALVHQRVLSAPSSTLQQEILKHECDATSDSTTIEECVFYALAHYEYNQGVQASKLVRAAIERANLDVALSGKMGRRTKYQTFDVPQLVLDVNTPSDGDDDAPPKKKEEKEVSVAAGAVPSQVNLEEDSILLEKVALTDDADAAAAAAELPLSPEQQCLLLLMSLQIKHENSQDALTRAQQMPYVEKVIQQPLDWTIHSTALLYKCRLESERTKTMDRAALQLQQLVEQVDTPDEKAASQHRTKYYFDVMYPCKWALERELGKRYLSLGMAASAQKIFERLEMWDDVVTCYRVMGATDQAIALIHRLLEETPEEPLLLCLLGELTHDPQLYTRAWEASNHRFGRAQRSLGSHYFAKQEWKQACEHFSTALAVNSLYPNTWFTMGCAAMNLQDWVMAARAFGEVVSQEPLEGEAWANLATVHLRAGKPKQAFFAVQQAVKQMFGNYRVWENLMYISLELNAMQEVVRAALRLMDLRENKGVDIRVLRFLVTNVVTGDKQWKRLEESVEQLVVRACEIDASCAPLWELRAIYAYYKSLYSASIEFRMRHCRALSVGDWREDEAKFKRVARAVWTMYSLCREHLDPKALKMKSLYVKSTLSKTSERFSHTDEHKNLKQLYLDVNEEIKAAQTK